HDFLSFPTRRSSDLNNQNAIYPRILANPATNILRSDFWLFDARYMRVKFIQLGYRLPKDITTKYGIKNTRIYLNAQNPFLFTDLDRKSTRLNSSHVK